MEPRCYQKLAPKCHLDSGTSALPTWRLEPLNPTGPRTLTRNPVLFSMTCEVLRRLRLLKHDSGAAFFNKRLKRPTWNLTLSRHRLESCPSPRSGAGLTLEVSLQSQAKLFHCAWGCDGKYYHLACLIRLLRLFGSPRSTLAVNNLKTCLPFGYHRARVAIKSEKASKRGWHRRSLRRVSNDSLS